MVILNEGEKKHYLYKVVEERFKYSCSQYHFINKSYPKMLHNLCTVCSIYKSKIVVALPKRVGLDVVNLICVPWTNLNVDSFAIVKK